MTNKLVRIGFMLACCLALGGNLMADNTSLIANGKTVKFHYTLKIENEVVHSTLSGEPETYVHGQSEIMTGLEKRLEGMKAGDKNMFSLAAEDAYGTVDPEAWIEVPIDKLPEGGNKEGTVLSVKDDQGQDMRAIVKEVRQETAILDFNHPLAGKELEFEVEVLEVS